MALAPTPSRRLLAALQRLAALRLLAALLLTAAGSAACSAACSADPPALPPGADAAPPLDPLPAPLQAESARFATHELCAQCHLAKTGLGALRDAAGRDVSPVATWRASLMALAARDPFYLAAFAEERGAHPAAAADIDVVCTRCHAPAISLEREVAGAVFGFDELVAGTGAEAALGRDGVTCSMCHQIQAAGLGEPRSFTGGFQVGFQRRVFGPYSGPVTWPMSTIVNYTPEYATHVGSSELCATCHTVIVRALDDAGAPTGPEIVEQATYFEWRSSVFAGAGPDAASCATCHLPASDDDGNPLDTAIATLPDALQPRSPFARHDLAGANGYMLRVIRAGRAFTQPAPSDAELDAAALRADAMARAGVTLELGTPARAGGELTLDVRVVNAAGHKLPTGYPGRRLWLHVRVTGAAGQVVFESGAVDARGALVGAGGARLDPPGRVAPHVDRVTSADDVPIWEGLLVDAAGAPARGPLGAARWGKDNRLLPRGFAPAGADLAATAPVGVIGDADFVAGSDTVHYRIAVPAGALTVEVRVLFQAVPPAVSELVAAGQSAAAQRFGLLVAATPPTPVELARDTRTLP